MRHEPIDETPPSIPLTTPTPPPTRTPGPKWSNTRLKIHTNSSKNPQSHRFYSPFALRDHRASSPDTAGIKRRLFTIVQTPRKKKTADQSSTSHIFRIAGGQERTQPFFPGSSSARKSSIENGVLTGQLIGGERNAALNMRVLKRLLGGCDLDVTELQRVVERGLVVRVAKMEEGVLVVNSAGEVGSREQFWVIPKDFDASTVDAVSGVLMFVPEPWSAIQIDYAAACPAGVLIIPFCLEILSESDLKTILKYCKVNQGLQSWLKANEDCESTYQVSEVQNRFEDGHCDGEESGPGNSTVVKAFSEISPHSMSNSIQVEVDAYLKEFGVAIVHDELGERAVYMCGISELFQASAPQMLIDIRICPRRFTAETMMGLLSSVPSCHVSADIHQLVWANSLPIVIRNN